MPRRRVEPKPPTPDRGDLCRRAEYRATARKHIEAAVMGLGLAVQYTECIDTPHDRTTTELLRRLRDDLRRVEASL